VSLAEELYIGLMSGTSLDGIDGVVARFSSEGRWIGVLGEASRPFPDGLRRDLLALQQSGPDELHRAALVANTLALLSAQVVEDLLQRCALPRQALRAVGSHGQTVRHQPGQHDGIGYTLQLNQPALLAERIGMDVIADFRSRDVAAGGQGAPLVPPFHQAVFGGLNGRRAVANIGGISNLTVLDGASGPIGFDCGPGNALLDAGARQHLGQPYDAAGAWSAGGKVHPVLLQFLQAEPFLSLMPPKSTGRDLFNPAWLASHLARPSHPPAPQDLQATLCEFTATCIARDVQRHASGSTELLVCGGGAFNADLLNRLRRQLPGHRVADTGCAGLPPLQVEAAAFAWLARQHCHRVNASWPTVTGAVGPRILGACYPAA
jgi:anhydro-N-acetylmuramic acid kinase